MKNLSIFLVSCLLIFSVGCSSIYDVSYDYDRNANLVSLKTYDWLPVPKEVNMDSLVVNSIKRAVNAQMVNKGLRMTSDRPDFLIAMHTGTEEKVSYTNWGYNYGSYWGGPRTSQFSYEEATLMLDFVDTKSKELMWRGVAKGFLDYNMTPEKTDKLVDEAVEKILKNFPPPSK